MIAEDRDTARGRLYLVPNLLGLVAPEQVLPERTIECARTLRHFVVENAKPARAYLKTLGMEIPISSLSIEPLPSTPTREACAVLLDPLRAGNDLGMISDAGCPGVADPGAALVAAAHRESIRVIPLVGPSSVLLALMASGMNGQAFAFHGYLPVAAEARARRLRALDEALARTGATQLFIETPYRNRVMLDAVLGTCHPDTELCVAADLTLDTEWIASAPVAAWKERTLPDLDKRPAMFLLGRAA